MIDKLKKLSQKNNGLIFTKDVTKAGLRRGDLKNLVDNKEIVQIKRGVYSFPNEILDEYYLLQLEAPVLIYSLSTALFFHGYSNRVPNIIDITVPQGYNVHRIVNDKIRVRYSKKDIYDLGVSLIKTPQGMKVHCYNLERTICDIIKARDNVDTQIFSDALNQYFKNKKINSTLLMNYARILKVEKEVIKYLEVMR